MIDKNEINKPVYTVKSIVHGQKAVLYVIHDEDGAWQFLDGGEVSLDYLMMVTFKQLIERDESLEVLLDLKPGFEAGRIGLDSSWTITKSG